VGRVREEKRDKRKYQREEKRARKQKMQAREKGSKVAKHCGRGAIWPEER
jgi:hypothetical protein